MAEPPATGQDAAPRPIEPGDFPLDGREGTLHVSGRAVAIVNWHMWLEGDRRVATRPVSVRLMIRAPAPPTTSGSTELELRDGQGRTVQAASSLGRPVTEIQGFVVYTGRLVDPAISGGPAAGAGQGPG